MADTKSAKLDQDFGLSPDDPLSKLANFFVVSDDPLAPEPASEPVIDMEQELLPDHDLAAEAVAPVDGTRDAAFDQAGFGPAAPPAHDMPAHDMPAEETPAEAGSFGREPGDEPETGAAYSGAAEAFDAPDHGLDAEFADLRWDDTPESAVDVDVPATGVVAETPGDAMGDDMPPAWEHGESTEWQPDEAPEWESGQAEAAGASPEPFAPVPGAQGGDLPGMVEQPAAAGGEGDRDDVLEEMMAADWSSRVDDTVEMPRERDGEAEAPASGLSLDHEWHSGDEATAFAGEDEFGADAATPAGAGDWTSAAPEQDADAAIPHAAAAAAPAVSFAPTTIEDELAALLAGEPGGRQPERQQPLDELDLTASTPDFEDETGVSKDEFTAYASSPSLDEATASAAAIQDVPQVRPAVTRMGRQTNFGWELPAGRTAAWSTHSAGIEPAAAAPADMSQDDPDAGETAQPAAPQGWNDGSPDQAGFTTEDALEPFADTDEVTGFEFPDDLAGGAARDVAAAGAPADEFDGSADGDDLEIDLPDFDESAFLDQSFVEDDLRLESHEPAPPAVPQPDAAEGEADFEIDADLLAEIEAIQMEQAGEPSRQDGPGMTYGDMQQQAAPYSGTSDAGSGAIAMGTGLAAGAAAAVGGLASRFAIGSRKAAAEPLPPEIETVEVPETRIDVADDLGLPDTAYQVDEQRVDAGDDLDELLAGDELSDSPGPVDQAHAGVDFETYFERELEDAGISFGGAKKPVHAPESQVSATVQEPVTVAVTPGGAHGAYEDALHDEDLERELAFDEISGTADEEPKSNRGLLIAAVVAGVALVGGIGAFVLTGGGGDTGDAPAIVRADPEPVKVKPENPGGTKVPNQNRAVYEEAAGAPAATQPRQETLVSNAETPVDVKSRPVRVVAPGPVDAVTEGTSQAGAANEAATGETAPAGKSEDRIDPAQAAGEPAPANELAAVAPRRVRTYVVRPDGTLVATEAPAPAAQAAADTEPAGTDAVAETGPAGPAGDAAGSTGQVEIADVPVPQPRPEIGGVDRNAEPAPAEPVAVAAQPAETRRDAAAAGNDGSPSLEPRQVRTTTIRRDTAAAPPVVPGRPADQPVNIVGTTRRDGQQAAAAAPAAETGLANANPPAWVQIASQPSRELAQSSYRNLSQRYGRILGGRGVNIVPADIPGRGTFYRVNIPAGSFAEAASLCREIKAAGGDCLPKR